MQGGGGLVVRSRLWGRRVPGSKPDSTEDSPCMGPVHAESYVVAKRPPVGVVRKFGEGVRAQVSSSSSDCDSKSRGPSQNSPCVASKLDVNITKPNQPALMPCPKPSRLEIPNLLYAYPWGYAKSKLLMAEIRKHKGFKKIREYCFSK
ncbi:hypothetical protein AVEN_216372-1 [Araneus ventricosus]|nr:hypothetical protein AVEN_63961-1 [Araneus ventricosus]GBN56918.1 hypothetical protein AVEN_216372-1 [Araneus ventricosus]